eukprot:TRINITY_DN33629_c0_g1_i1.p1 TRINITY_DN33629_c0_g1~~TRINITY_DN33629_c0_g1_i1.p1  ORF type:complete len:227 (-),score=58.16 TRINITY_DN33629_c0_g1_i1:117-797(-)
MPLPGLEALLVLPTILPLFRTRPLLLGAIAVTDSWLAGEDMAAASGLVMPLPGLEAGFVAESMQHALKIDRSDIDALGLSLPKVSEQRAAELMAKALADLCNGLSAEQAAKATKILTGVVSGKVSKQDMKWIRKQLEGGVAKSICKIKALQQAEAVDESTSPESSLWSTPSGTPTATLMELPDLDSEVREMHQRISQLDYLHQNRAKHFHQMRALQEFHQVVYDRL